MLLSAGRDPASPDGRQREYLWQRDISGCYIALSQNGATVATGFTTATFTLSSGQTYTVQADSYGSCNFAYWLRRRLAAHKLDR